MPTAIWFVVPALLLVWLAWTWNRLVAIRNAMRAAWASIDALLKRRADLIPNLVSVVRGGMDYEADTLTNVVHARNGVINATDVHDRARSEELLTGAVKQLFALVESYPELRANEAILKLQKELVETETDIASARRYYNAVVRDYDTLRQSFPNLLVAGLLGFGHGQYFDATETERQLPTTDLSRNQ